MRVGDLAVGVLEYVGSHAVEDADGAAGEGGAVARGVDAFAAGLGSGCQSGGSDGGVFEGKKSLEGEGLTSTPSNLTDGSFEKG